MREAAVNSPSYPFPVPLHEGRGTLFTPLRLPKIPLSGDGRGTLFTPPPLSEDPAQRGGEFSSLPSLDGFLKDTLDTGGLLVYTRGHVGMRPKIHRGTH